MTDTDLRAALERLHGLIEQELALVPEKANAFDSGAAAAYNYVLSEWPDVAALAAPAADGLDVVSPARLYDALWLLKDSRRGDDAEFPTLPEVRTALSAAYLDEPSREPGEEG